MDSVLNDMYQPVLPKRLDNFGETADKQQAMALPFHFICTTAETKTIDRSSFHLLTLASLLIILVEPAACYLQVPDLSLDNVNTAIQLTRILYKVSSPYADNLQWDSFYPETFWHSESWYYIIRKYFKLGFFSIQELVCINYILKLQTFGKKFRSFF